MIVALIDNGSLEPAVQRNLRAVAAVLSARTGVAVEVISWKHSDRILAAALAGIPAWTLTPWLRAQLARGEREFVFVPFFISAQGAIGSALRSDLEKLRREAGGFTFAFTDGLATRDTLAGIVAEHVRETIAVRKLFRPSVVVVDHGGPSPASAALRDRIAAEVRLLLTTEIGPLTAASLEGEAHIHNRPLFADALATPGFDRGDVIVAPLFLAPGRHAGVNGDLAQIARAAEDRATTLRFHFTALVGAHPRIVDALASALRETCSAFPIKTAA